MTADNKREKNAGEARRFLLSAPRKPRLQSVMEAPGNIEKSEEGEGQRKHQQPQGAQEKREKL